MCLRQQSPRLVVGGRGAAEQEVKIQNNVYEKLPCNVLVNGKNYTYVFVFTHV